MTEQEWLTSEDPDHLLKWLQRSKRFRPAPRKLGLFACACARRLGARVTDAFTMNGLNLAERMAEGIATEKECRAFHRRRDSQHGKYVHIAVWAVRVLENENWTSHETSARSVAGYVACELGTGEPELQSQLLRDVIGNPYRPVMCDAIWRSATVVAIAQAICDQQSFSNLPILADALEDAGCDNSEILAHLRGPGPHVRGCWAVDLLLGK